MWPSAVVLARWIATNPFVCFDGTMSILEIGAGCGLVGLFVARMIQQQKRQHNQQEKKNYQDSSNEITFPSVVLTDFNRDVLDNLKYNISLNDLNDICSTQSLDFYQQQEQHPQHSDSCVNNNSYGWINMNGQHQPPVDVVLGADIICQPSDATAIVQTMYNALRAGGCGYIVCATSTHRYGVDCFPQECERFGLSVQVENVANLYNGALLRSDGHELEKTAGFVNGMELSFFTVVMPK